MRSVKVNIIFSSESDMANTTYETVQTGCSGVSESGTNIIFIEKRKSFPASYEQGRHAALARSLGRTYNAFLTKMDALSRLNELRGQPV